MMSLGLRRREPSPNLRIDPPAPRPRSRAALIGLALLLGVGARFVDFASGRALWLDEAMLACNIAGRTFAGLLEPLDDAQGAPPGFLVLEKLAILALGPTEAAFRLLPLAASLATLGLIAVVARRGLGPGAAGLAVTLAALCPALIAYAGEAKQYGVDACVALALLALAVPAWKEGLTTKRAAMLALAGALAVWLSHPSAFVVAGVGTTLIVSAALRRDGPSAARAALASAVAAASFAAEYALILRSLNRDAYLNDFWSAGFLPLPPRSPAEVQRLVAIVLDVFEAPFKNQHLSRDVVSERMGLVAMLACGVGAVALWRGGRRALLAMLTAPLGVAALASALHKYPLSGRLTLFASGPLFVLMAAGLHASLRSADALLRGSGRVLLVALLALPTLQVAQAVAESRSPYGARVVLEGVARSWRPGDVAIVDGASEPPFRFYRTSGRIAGLDRVEAVETESELRRPEELAREVVRWRGRPRVWLLMTDHMPDPGAREDGFLRLTLDRLGRHVATIRARGYLAHLYDFASRPPDRDGVF